jgi:hypothetical protein
MLENGIKEMASFDKGFDIFNDIKRVGWLKIDIDYQLWNFSNSLLIIYLKIRRK